MGLGARKGSEASRAATLTAAQVPVEEQIIGITAIMEPGQVLA